MHWWASAALAAAVACAACASDQPRPSILDLSDPDLVRTLPELSRLRWNHDPDRLGAILHATGEAIETMLGDFVDSTAQEDVHETKLGAHTVPSADHRARYRYTARLQSDEAAVPVLESRTAEAPQDRTEDNGRLMMHFMWSLDHLLPANQSQSGFRYLGREPS